MKNCILLIFFGFILQCTLQNCSKLFVSVNSTDQKYCIDDFSDLLRSNLTNNNSAIQIFPVNISEFFALKEPFMLENFNLSLQ